MSDYKQGIKFLLSLETQGIKMGLNRTKQLLTVCNNPEKNLKSVQIIGTNGKGSTAASLSSILEQKKLKIGLYTSPHLVTLNERIQINRENISNQYINRFISQYHQDILALSCTFFEVMTVVALQYFNDNNVDIALLETGLGGQFDSVTACKPSLQLFTSISKDHMHILGNSLEEIATEKALAIQPGVPCISVDQKPSVKKILDHFASINNTCINYNSSYKNLNDITLLGDHQKHNVGLAISAANNLIDINQKHILAGIKNIYWPGRNQIIHENPTVIFDVAHNEESLIKFLNTIKSIQIKGQKVLLISIQKSKKINKIINKMTTYFDYIVCTQLNDRMYNAEELLYMFSNGNSNVKSSDEPSQIINKLMKTLDEDDILAIIGSHYWGPHIEKSFKNLFAS